MMDLLRHVARHAERRPKWVAYREVTNTSATARTQTYAGLVQAVSEVSSRLRTVFAAGSTLLVRIPNTCDYPAAFLGVLAAECAAFPVPADAAEPEVCAAIDQSGAVAVIGPGLTISPSGRVPMGQRRHGLLLQSSGTTGRPKIVYRPAAAVDAVCANMVGAIGFTDTDRVLATVPLCHSYGLEHGLLAPLTAGASIHLCQGFDLHLVLGQLAGAGISVFPAVPSMFEMLAQLADERSRFPALRTTYSAGGQLPSGIAEAFFRKYGLRIAQLYGASEVGSVTFTRSDDPAFDSSSVGRPMHGVDIRIGAVNDQAQVQPTGTDGQVLVRATSMFTGYLNGESGVTSDGFFPTGDLGRVDASGNLTITGRIKLLIDVGGLKVNPLEVEEVLRQHPGVAACVAVPMRLSETISRIRAVVVPVDPATPPAAEELRRFARARLTPHKVPRVFEFRDKLPTSATGKILRHLVEA